MERRAPSPVHDNARVRKKERMATEFKLPELGENIESGDLVRLMIKPGASITEGEPVMELETDKAVVEVPSSVTGTIGEIRVKEGDKLRVGQVIFTVENGAGAGKSPRRKRPRNLPRNQAEIKLPRLPSPQPLSSQPNRSRPFHLNQSAAQRPQLQYLPPPSSNSRNWERTSTPAIS